MNEPVIFKLNKQELDSELWMKLKAWHEDGLASCRKRNDTGMNEIETANLRGMIALHKRVLNLDSTNG